MTDQQSDHASVSPAVQTYYSKRILKAFEPKTVLYQAAPVTEPIPQGEGNSVVFTRYKKLPYLRGDNTDEFTAQQLWLTTEVVTAELHSRDGYVQVSRFADLTARGKFLDKASDKVKSSAAKTLDILVRNDIGMMVADVAATSSLNYANMAIDGGTLNSTGITARIWSRDKAGVTGETDRFPVYHNKLRIAQSATVVSIAKTALTVKTLQDGVSVMEEKDVPEAPNGFYNLVTRPRAAYQITTSPGFKGWFSPTSSEPIKNKPSQTGIIANVKVWTTTLAYRFPLSGDTLSTSSGALYASLLFGDEAYGVSELTGNQGREGFQFFLKQSGSQTTSDPTNRKKQAAFSIDAVAKILNKSAGMWILSTEIN